MDKNMTETISAPSPNSSFYFDAHNTSHIPLPLMIFLNIGVLLLFIYPCYRCYKLAMDCLVEPPSNVTAMESHGNFDIVIELRDLERGPPEWERPKPCIFDEVSWTAHASRETRCEGGDGDDSCTECCICLDEFMEGDECKVCSNCNHVYHNKCIEKWLIQSTSCPLCRGFVGWGIGGDHWCEISLSLPD